MELLSVCAWGFPRRWCHTALPHFHEVVELSVDGEGGDIATGPMTGELQGTKLI